MAKNNHNLDNFFREKLSGYESPGKTGNWQLMNHLLEEKHRRRKMLKRFFLGMVLLVAVLSSYFIFIPGRDKSKNLASNENIRQLLLFLPPVIKIMWSNVVKTTCPTMQPKL
jgi:hypothetical protein